jgi:hypothetical protein
MKLPVDALIADEKLTRYLLASRKRNDKSNWLAQAGYTLDNWQVLGNDLRRQILSLEATAAESTPYGQTYEIRGRLTGPNGNELAVCTVWMTEKLTGVTKFITMYPDRRRKKK